MMATFELIDMITGDVYGPYITLSEAIAQADRFDAYEIVSEGQLVCERCAPQHSDEAMIPH